MFVDELDKSQEGVKQNKINMSNDGFAKTTNNSKIDQLYIFFSGFVNDVSWFRNNFYPGRCNSRCCWAAESAWKNSPALTTADQGDLMHEGSSTRFTRFSVFDLGFVETKTWEVVLFKNEDFRMVWRLPTSGNPYKSLINMVEFWGMIFWDVGDLFFAVSQDSLQMANELNWLVSTILWTFNYHVILSHLSKQNQYLSWRCHKVCRSFARNLTRMQEPLTFVFRA